jgi:hypothetical protein
MLSWINMEHTFTPRVKPHKMTTHFQRRLRHTSRKYHKTPRTHRAWVHSPYTLFAATVLLFYIYLMPFLLVTVAVQNFFRYQFTPHWSSRTSIPRNWSSLFLFEEVSPSIYTYDIDFSRDSCHLPTIPPPLSSGGCWRDLWDPDPEAPISAFEFNGWMPQFAFKRIALRTGTLIPLIKLADQLYHYAPSEPTARFYRPSRLPQGWYGMRPDMFDGSALKTTVLAMHIQDYTQSLTESRAQAPFAVKPTMLRHLDRAGIQTPLDGALSHPHPIHYAFENRMLQLAGMAIRNQPWFALFLNPAKIRRMRNSIQLNPPTGYFNPTYEGKDITRFNQTPGGATTDHLPVSDSPVWFAHDVLHHMNPSSVGDWFDTNPTLKYLFATAVIPPELVADIAPQNPRLYNFEVHGSTMTYIPEEHIAGSYYQPVSCARWLTANRIVTPAGECLHVAKIDGIRAHNLFVISRPQLIPDMRTNLDIPGVAVIPQTVHPLGSLNDRLTDPTLMEHLVNYAARATATNLRDLYAKTAAHAAERYGHFPSGYTRAAVLFAIHSRVIDWHSKLSYWDYFTTRLAYFTGLPIASMSWLLQSQSSKAFSRCINGTAIWSVRMTTWVAHPSDSLLPGLRNNLCDAHDVPFFYVPPRPTLAARLASFNAALHLSLGGKLLGFFAWWLIKASSSYWLPTLNKITYLLGLNWQDTPFALGLIFLLYFFGFRVPDPHFYPVHRPIWTWTKTLYATYFFLPSAKSGYNAGLSLSYQLLLCCTTFTKFFPRLNPIYYYHPSHKLHVVLLLLSISAQLLVASLTIRYSTHYSTLPHHKHVHVEDGPEPFCDKSTTQASVHSTTSSEFGDIEQWIYQTNTGPETSDVPHIPRVVVTPASDSSSDVSIEDIPVVVRNGDLLQPFAFRPDSFPNPAMFSRVLANCPNPVILPDANSMCVWECLGPTLGVAPDRLLACWLASLSLRERGNFANGGVPRDQLERIFTFFGVGVTLRPAVMNVNNCPRAPGVNGTASTNPASIPISVGQARAEWPSVTYYIGNSEGGNFHLTSTASNDPNVNPDIPHADEPVGYTSRSVPLIEIMEILNVPIKIWNTCYHRLTGNLNNAAASLHTRFNGIVAYRAQFNPLPVLPVAPQSVQYVVTPQDAIYARNLATDMKNNPHTLNLREMNAHSVAVSFDALAKQAERQIVNGTFARDPVELVILHGMGGSGKTTALSNYLANSAPPEGYNSSNLRFHTWLNQLRGPLERRMFQQPWVRASNLVSHNFATGVMPLVQPFGGTLVLDDATQCWSGFIPLIVMCNPGISRIVVTMDATQGRTVFPEADSLSRADISTAEWLASKSDYYATQVHRYSQELGDLFGVPTAAPTPGNPVRHGRIYITSRAPRNVPLLVVSPRFSETQNNGGTRCLTFRECQGQDVAGDIAIDLGGLTSTATEHAVWTALTRAQGNVFLVLGASMSQNPTLVETTYGNSQILSAILCVAAANQTAEITVAHDPDRLVARAVHNHLASCLSANARANLGLPVATPIVGKQVSEQLRSDWLCEDDNYAVGDYYTARAYRSANSKSRTSAGAAFSRHQLKQHSHDYDLGHALRHVAIYHNDLNVLAPGTDYTLPPPPILNSKHDPINNFDREMDDAAREITYMEVDTSFQHIHDGPHAMLHHNGQDRVTQRISEKKRIRVGKDAYTLTSVEKKKLQQMKRGFSKFFNLTTWNDEKMHAPTFASACQDFLAPWVSKRTRKAIDRSLARNPLDSPYNFTRLFLKGQYIKKEDKRYKHALPGQIVSEFPLGKQFRDAPFALYLERMALRHAYPSTYLHARASPADTSSWYKKHWTRGEMTANDYTAWDNGCDRTTVAFVEWLMSDLCGMPNEYVKLYVFDRMNVYSHLGPHKPKQESGDRFTWIVNSLVNAAITGASLNCPKRTACGFSGDDSIVCGSWRKPLHFNPDDWLMKPKPEFGTTLTFCGMQFGGVDVYFDTLVILHRAQNGFALGRSDPDYWRSISDSIREAGSKAPDYDENLASAEFFLDTAKRVFKFSL